jgi:uncharacterized protein YdeI (YjbR/CyaY-like superfamily)
MREVVMARPATEIPADLAAALAGCPPAGASFAALAASHRAEYLRWIDEAKRPETRARRIASTVERLRRPPGA